MLLCQVDRYGFIRKIRKAPSNAMCTTMDLSGKFRGLSWTLCYFDGMSLVVQKSSDIVRTSVGCLWYFVYGHLARMVHMVHSCLD